MAGCIPTAADVATKNGWRNPRREMMNIENLSVYLRSDSAMEIKKLNHCEYSHTLTSTQIYIPLREFKNVVSSVGPRIP